MKSYYQYLGERDTTSRLQQGMVITYGHGVIALRIRILDSRGMVLETPRPSGQGHYTELWKWDRLPPHIEILPEGTQPGPIRDPSLEEGR